MEYYYPLLDVRGACRMVDGFSLMFSLFWALMTLETLTIFFNQREAVLIPTWFSCLPLTRPKKVDERQRVKADQREVCHWPFFGADDVSAHYRHWRFLPAVLILREAHELFGKRKANVFSLRSKRTVAPRSAVIRAAKSQNTCEDLGYFCSRERDCFFFFFFHVVPLQHNSNVRMRMLELGDNPATHQVHLMRDSSSEIINLDRSFSLSFHYIYIIYTGEISTFTQVLYLSVVLNFNFFIT